MLARFSALAILLTPALGAVITPNVPLHEDGFSIGLPLDSIKFWTWSSGECGGTKSETVTTPQNSCFALPTSDLGLEVSWIRGDCRAFIYVSHKCSGGTQEVLADTCYNLEYHSAIKTSCHPEDSG